MQLAVEVLPAFQAAECVTGVDQQGSILWEAVHYYSKYREYMPKKYYQVGKSLQSGWPWRWEAARGGALRNY